MQILAKPVKKKVKYSLAELLVQSDFEADCSNEMEDWVNFASAGDELL